MKTKNYDFYFTFSHWLWDWALPLKVNLESKCTDYFEVELQILCFYFCFTRVAHKFSKKVDDFVEGKTVGFGGEEK